MQNRTHFSRHPRGDAMFVSLCLLPVARLAASGAPKRGGGGTSEAPAKSLFLETRRRNRTDDRCARAHSLRIRELVERNFETRIGFAHAVSILKNRFAVGEH